MITLIGGTKGGTGKTTVATNLCVFLAHAGLDVLLLDADPQATSSMWANERSQRNDLRPVHCVQRTGNLIPALRDLENRYQHIVVDCGGFDSEGLRSALVVADVLYSPVVASQFDLWTARKMLELVSLAGSMNPKLKAHWLLSMCETNPLIRGEADDGVELLQDLALLSVARTRIHRRKAYRDVTTDGRGVIETSNIKASEEISALAMEVFGGTVQTSSSSDHAAAAVA
jgi:chromosome partitioning protein